MWWLLFVVAIGLTATIALAASPGNAKNAKAVTASPTHWADSKLLPVTPLTANAGTEHVTLSLRTGSTDVRLRVEADGRETALRIVEEECPAAAEGTLRTVVDAEFSSLPWQRSDCGLKLDAKTYFEIRLADASPSVQWRVRVQSASASSCWSESVPSESFDGWAMTNPGLDNTTAGEFDIVVFADSHLFVPLYSTKLNAASVRKYELQGREVDRLFNISTSAAGRSCHEHRRNAYVLQMGDPFDLRCLGDFMMPLTTVKVAEDVWDYMTHKYTAPLAPCGPIYNVVGNWEGETKCSGPYAELAEQIRSLHFPPSPGSGPAWYTISAGQLLVVVLHVLKGSPKCHSMGMANWSPEPEGTETEFRLGEEQQQFLAQTLKQSTHAFKIIAVHHPFGGKAIDVRNTRYGRGGAKAALVGEQAWIHKLMLKHSVQIFLHGHDHIFFDEKVDGIHYTCAGSVSAPWQFFAEGVYPEGQPGRFKQWGFLRLTVNGSSNLDVSFINAELDEVINTYRVTGPQ